MDAIKWFLDRWSERKTKTHIAQLFSVLVLWGVVSQNTADQVNEQITTGQELYQDIIGSIDTYVGTADSLNQSTRDELLELRDHYKEEYDNARGYVESKYEAGRGLFDNMLGTLQGFWGKLLAIFYALTTAFGITKPDAFAGVQYASGLKAHSRKQT